MNTNNLWYIGDHLLIPCFGIIQEYLFHLAHDTAGHFRADKSYWPNMHWDLEKSYISLCPDCLCNKSSTWKHIGPLCPLPIPNDCGDSITLDFIGPLPLDDSFNYILTMTDWLGLDIRIIPTQVDINTEDLTLLFFNNWYCENGLPKEIIHFQILDHLAQTDRCEA